MKTYYISPSDVTFLWSDCPRCFYLKVTQGIRRPNTPMPQIFNHIDRLMKNLYVNKNLKTFSDDFPDAIYKYPDQWVQSKPIVLKNKDVEIVFRGKIDGLLEYIETNAQGEKVFNITDLKTTQVNDNTTPMYGISLHMYAYCLENAAQGEFSVKNVDHLSLIVFEPNSYTHEYGEEPSLNGIHHFIEFEKDMNGFKDWMNVIFKVITKDTPPDATEQCGFCKLKNHEKNTVS
jgi:hypothetical protein